MPKSRVTAVLNHTNDATFREWVTICENLLAASGLIRTSDSGQIDPATAIKPPTTGGISGYSIWRFSDPLQAVAPVFLKVEYATSTASTSAAGCVFSVGRGSDGAGNLIDVFGGRFSAYNNGSDATALREFMCVHNAWGAALIVGAASGTNNSTLGFGVVIQRTCESDGTPSADGLLIHVPGTTNSSVGLGRAVFAQFLPTVSAAIVGADTVALLPLGLASYVVGTSPQVFPTWVALPKVRPMNFFAVGPYAGSPGVGQTFSMAVVGTQSRTYICIGAAVGRHFYPSLSSTAYIMWED